MYIYFFYFPVPTSAPRAWNITCYAYQSVVATSQLILTPTMNNPKTMQNFRTTLSLPRIMNTK